MDRERIIAVFFFAFLALITYELYALLAPFLTPIAWAILLAFLAHPALTAVNRVIKNRTVCALLLTLAVALCVILPAIWLSARLVYQAQKLYLDVSTLTAANGLAGVSGWVQHTHVGTKAARILARRGIRLEDELRLIALRALKVTSDYVVVHGEAVAGNIASFVFHFAIALLTFFYLLRDGETYYEGLRELTPLHEEDKAAVFDTLRLTLSSVMRGLMLSALLDGVVLGLGYLLLGVPYWALLALLTAAVGLLPIGGTALVWIPVAVYLAMEAGWGLAAGMFGWALITLLITDNFVKPIAMRHGTGLPTLALFFALAGGLELYGPIGLFAGPAVMAIFAALLRVYRRTYVGETAPARPAQLDLGRRRFRRQK